eukprot:TRINITY_DN725_c4_g1_i1.p1 TRINITY_DN725_c4_g1~~TRINITY_DN725_c4_g1_i1.p1  ORF type:complete len:811 (+),score=265.10 TRINITY_DN725_c4_g1_i1:949-3381(+)
MRKRTNSVFAVEDGPTSKETSNSSQNTLSDELELEKLAQQKEQRVNERFLKQLEDLTIRASSLEMEYRSKERDFKQKESALKVELEKLRVEVEREKAEINDEMAKAQSKIEFKQKTFQDKLLAKKSEHQKIVEDLKYDIEEAQDRMEISSRIQELEVSIREETEDYNDAEMKNRKLDADLENVLVELEKERANLDQFKEQLQELENSNKELIEVTNAKDNFERELVQVRKNLEKLTKEAEDNKDNPDTIVQLKSKARQLKNKNDDLLAERIRIEKAITRLKSGLDQLESQPASTSTSPSTDPRSATATTAGGTDRKTERLRERERERETDTSRQDERRIRDLKQEIKTMQREKERELEGLDRQLGTSEAAASKALSAHNKIEAEQKDLTKLIKQTKEMGQVRLNILREQLQFFTNRNELNQNELKKESKAASDGEWLIGENKRLIEDQSKMITEKKKLNQELIDAIDQKQKAIEKLEKDIKTELKQLQETRDKLNESESSLKNYQQMVDETNAEFKETRKDVDLEIHTSEAEIYYQTEEYEELLKANAQLTAHLNSLHWYFKPMSEKTVQENKWYRKTGHNFLEEIYEGRKKELEDILDDLHTSDIDHKQQDLSAEDFKKNLDRFLRQMDQEEKNDLLWEMKDFTLQMTKALFKQRTILQIIALLAEHQVYPGAIRELTEITKNINHQHFLNRTDTLLKNTYSEWTRDPDTKSFRRRLMDKLVYMRMKRTGKSFEQSEDFIFYGKERLLDEIDAEQQELQPAKKARKGVSKTLDYNEDSDQEEPELNPDETVDDSVNVVDDDEEDIEPDV